MSTKRRTAYAFIGFFLILCLIPSLGMAMFGSSKAGANEILSPKPALREKDGSLNFDCLSELSDYLTDRCFLRQELITLRNKLSVNIFGTSPNEKVTLGREDWLFYAETLSGIALSDHELWCAAENLKLLEEYAESRGSEFLFVLCPNKSSLCTDPVGYGTPSTDGQRFETLLDSLGVAHCSLYGVLRMREDCFYHADSHWNGYGAAVAADAINAALGRSSDYAAGPFREGSGHAGDLSEMLYPASPTVETELLYDFSFSYTSNYHAPNDLSISTQGQGEGSLFCYRDSFGNDLHPYLAEGFQSARFSRKTSFDLTALSEDVLLIELVERNIDYLSRYDHTYPAPERKLNLSTQSAEAVSANLSEEGGLVRISGELASFDEAPLYLRVDGRLYECAPKSAGFTLCLPEWNGEAELIYQSGGRLYAAPVILR